MNALILLFALLFQLIFNSLTSVENSKYTLPANEARDWKSEIILRPDKKKPARTAVLIICAPNLGTGVIENRWELGKKVWESYMNSNPNIDSYFVECTFPRKNSQEQVWQEGNTIYVGDTWYEKHQQDRILYKTVKALEFLSDKYTHFIRTNLNTFINLKAANNYMETHHQSMYTAFLWQKEWYTTGYGILFSSDVSKYIVEQYMLMEQANVELIDCRHADDCALTGLATGIWPLDQNHPFQCYPKLPNGIRQLMSKGSFETPRVSQYAVFLNKVGSLEEAIGYVNQASDEVILYRIRDELNLDELTVLYRYLLNKTYPELVSSRTSF